MRLHKSISYILLLMVVTGLCAWILQSVVTRYFVSQAEDQLHYISHTQRALHLYIQQVMHPEFYRARDAGEISGEYYAPEILSSSYVVREMHSFFNLVSTEDGDPEIYYKIAADNPRNPKNKADAEESRLIRYFNENRGSKKFDGIREIDGVRYLVYVAPFLETNQACLRCHGKREDAPEGLQQRYPGNGGFNEKPGEIRAVESIRVPIGSVFSTAKIVTVSLVAGLLSVLLLILFNMRLRSRVTQRTTELEQEVEQRKRSEESLLATNDVLENVAEEARRANEVKSLFLANMSHELRTPLNGLIASIQLLKDADLTEDDAELVRLSEECGWSLLTLLNEILDLTMIESGKLTLRPSLVSVREVAETAMMLLRPNAEKKGLHVLCKIAPDLPEHITIDGTRLRQIVLNLLGNAIKFTHHGTITIDFRGELNPDTGPSLILTVTDNGIGIAPADLQRIFEPFTQGDESYTKSFQGAGLGLTIVKRLCDAMGGRVEIMSTQGVGTSIRVELPLISESSEQGASGIVSPSVPLAETALAPLDCHILVVEDNPVNLLMVERLLEKLKCRVATATTGQEALERLAGEDYDLVLLDIQLPDIGGVEVFRRVRSGAHGARNPSIPVVALTAYAMAGDREKFLEAGMDDYLSKPVELKVLAATLRKHCRQGAGIRQS